MFYFHWCAEKSMDRDGKNKLFLGYVLKRFDTENFENVILHVTKFAVKSARFMLECLTWPFWIARRFLLNYLAISVPELPLDYYKMAPNSIFIAY